MDIRISRASGVPLRTQVGQQIAVLIITGKLKPGEYLPSVRALANRLKIHHNTVSQAYQDLADYSLVERHRGSRMMVPRIHHLQSPEKMDLDDVINLAIETAEEHGFTLQQLRQRVQERLMAQPPDHVLVVAEEDGGRELIRAELTPQLDCAVATCSVEELEKNPGLAIGAVVVGPPATLRRTIHLIPKDRPPFTVTYNATDRYVELVKKLREPSAIAVVSVSEFFLESARGLLAPALGNEHTLREFFLPREKPGSLNSFSLVFCDTISREHVKTKNRFHYKLLSEESIRSIVGALKR